MKRSILLFVLIIFINLNGQSSVGLAFSGGGARALAHIGVLKVIEEENIKIDYISGTSSGALIGALFSIGYSADEIEDYFLELDWRELLSDKLSRQLSPVEQKRWKPISNIYFSVDDNFSPILPTAFSAGNELINTFFDQTYHVAHLRDYSKFPIPFSCVATNLISSEAVIMNGGSLHESIRASMSFPTILKPFEIENILFVDGGMNQNLPIDVVKDMGAEFVIGICTSSGLRNREDIVTMIDVVEQTMGFQINKNVANSAKGCNILIEPDLDGITYLDFDKAQEIIDAGERAARIYIEKLGKLPQNIDEVKENDFLSEHIRFSKISVKGNKYLSSSKIKEYLGIDPGELYSLSEIRKVFAIAYNMNLFELLYPTIDQIQPGKFHLIVNVKEKNRKRMGLGFSYNEENEFSAGFTLELSNYVQKNSKLLFNVKAGENTQVNLDYVKNFGRLFGIYFRLFPNFQEKTIYSYNEDHEKMNSVKSNEKGVTFGVGMFANKLFNLELYGFTCNTKMYRNIADFETTSFRTSGLGMKVLFETLNNYMFPMQGIELIAKLSGASRDYYSDEGYSKFYSRMRFLFPICEKLSTKYGFEYGSYFEHDNMEMDPFYIGGIDSFPGLKNQEMSAPIFKIHILSLRYRIIRSLFFDIQYNRMNLGNSDVWLPENNFYQAAGIKLGYDSIIGPVRSAFFVDSDRKVNFYLSIGYEFDAFEFSRR